MNGWDCQWTPAAKRTSGPLRERTWAGGAIKLIVAAVGDQDYIYERYLTELVNGIYRDEARQGLVQIAQRLRREHGIEGHSNRVLVDFVNRDFVDLYHRH